MEQSTQQLIDKFWAGTATDAEKRQLADALDAPTADWQAELRRAFDQQDPTTGALTAGQSARVLLRLHRQIQGEQAAQLRISVWRQWGGWAAAAMVLLVAGLGVWFVQRSTQPEPTLAQQPSGRWHLTHHTNPTTTPQRMSLADGSTLTLQPGSSVSYYEPFGQSSRDISMTGDVLYAVAKDPAHPFTVLAEGITTTALGTQFRVQTTTRHRVSVRLLEGRVVVRATPASGLTMGDTYLKPGQELNVDIRSARLSVTTFRDVSAPTVVAAQPVVVPPVRAELPVLVFAKEPLETVLQRVSQRYNVPIDFDPADVQGLSFSGSFASGDSLTVVLKAICLTNNLSFTQETGRVVVRRAP